jgi:hypothetical protein
MTEQCSGCGIGVTGGTQGCQALFEQLTGRGFSEPAYGRVHRTVVDTYCLQHPEQYCASAKSLAAHLCGLGWTIEHGGHPSGERAIRRWLNGAPPLEKPELPAKRGSITIRDVLEAPDAAAHAREVEQWARSAWEAYAALHRVARQWILQALAAR